MSNFHRQLEVGKVGESEIARWLMSKGYNILPVYEIAEGQYKGPAVFSKDGKGIIAPDIFAFSNSDVKWIEAKTKTAFSWHRKTEKWTTGIDKNLFEHYKQIAELAPWPVWLLFLQKGGQAKDSEVSEAGLFGGSIKFLAKNINHDSDNYGPYGMFYWAQDVLKKIADYPLPDESINEWIKDYDRQIQKDCR